ncbi:hypothetical protein QQ045_002287 [Rhodiola kirilowii]
METKISNLPVKYLGVTLNSKGIKRNDCSVLIEKVKKRLQSWSNIFLSRADSLSGRACYLASWRTVCKPTREGGLSIKDLKIMNESLVLSQFWDIEKKGINGWSGWRSIGSKGDTRGILTSKLVILGFLIAFLNAGSWKCIQINENKLKWIGKGTGFNV